MQTLDREFEQLKTLPTSEQPVVLDGVNHERPSTEVVLNTPIYEATAEDQSSIEKVRGEIQLLSQEQLKAKLALQIRADVEQFKQELNLGQGWMDKLTKAMPKIRAFWKHRYTGWARLGLGLGLTGAVIASAASGAFAAAFGWVAARAVLGFASTFMASQELQASMARQHETHSVKEALADTSQRWWKRGWNAAKNFMTDGFDVIATESANLTPREALRQETASLGHVMVEEAKQSKTTRDINEMQTEVIDRVADAKVRRFSTEDGQVDTRLYTRYERLVGRARFVAQFDTQQEALRQEVKAGQQVARMKTRNSLIGASAVAGTIGLIGTDFGRLAETGKWIATAASDLVTNPVNTMNRFLNWQDQVVDTMQARIANAPSRIASAATDFKERAEDAVGAGHQMAKEFVQDLQQRVSMPLGPVPAYGEGIQDAFAPPTTEDLVHSAGFESDQQRHNYGEWLEKVYKKSLQRELEEVVLDSKAKIHYYATSGEVYDFTKFGGDAMLRAHAAEFANDPEQLYKFLSLKREELEQLVAVSETGSEQALEDAIGGAYKDVFNRRQAELLIQYVREFTHDPNALSKVLTLGIHELQIPSTQGLVSTTVDPTLGVIPTLLKEHSTSAGGRPSVEVPGSGRSAVTVTEILTRAEVKTAPELKVTEPIRESSVTGELPTTKQAIDTAETNQFTLKGVHEAKDITLEQRRQIHWAMVQSNQFAKSLGYSEQQQAVLQRLDTLYRNGTRLVVQSVVPVGDGTRWVSFQLDEHTLVKVRLTEEMQIADGVAKLTAKGELVNRIGLITRDENPAVSATSPVVHGTVTEPQTGGDSLGATRQVEPVTTQPTAVPTPMKTPGGTLRVEPGKQEATVETMNLEILKPAELPAQTAPAPAAPVQAPAPPPAVVEPPVTPADPTPIFEAPAVQEEPAAPQAAPAPAEQPAPQPAAPQQQIFEAPKVEDGPSTKNLMVPKL